nr:hypothetical protein [Tanacetum cinerariifolium]
MSVTVQAKQPPWPNSRGKDINESATSWTKVICLAIKFLKIDSASRSLNDEEELKWMDREWAKLHAQMCTFLKNDILKKRSTDAPSGLKISVCEVKAMADMHQRKAGTAKHSDNGG